MLSDTYESKVGLYHQALTPEVIAAVETCLPQGGRLLDIGCSTGNLLRRFRHTASFLGGIDVASSACAVAAEFADVVANASIESDDLPFEDHSFDVVVCADVLEHLHDPSGGLRRAMQFCRPDGAIIISVPNIAYWRARLRLLVGIWEYEDVGIFDNSHLRFFTYESIHELIALHGLAVTNYEPILRPFWQNLRGFRRLPQVIQDPIEAAWNRLGWRRPTLFAYQHVCTCRRRDGLHAVEQSSDARQ